VVDRDALRLACRTALATFPAAPARLVEPLEICGDMLAEAYVYACYNDGWLALVDREVRTDSIALPIRQFSGTRTFILRRCLERPAQRRSR
jgi:hypothetical protein